jgi:transcriptional regulator with XRE-family HTH domain
MTNKAYNSFGQLIKELRLKNKRSLTSLSQALEISTYRLSAYEQGKQFPDVECTLKIENALNAPDLSLVNAYINAELALFDFKYTVTVQRKDAS